MNKAPKNKKPLTKSLINIKYSQIQYLMQNSIWIKISKLFTYLYFYTLYTFYKYEKNTEIQKSE